MRLGALLNDAQNCGRSPTSVAGGDCAAGNWLAKTSLCGPGSVVLAGFVALTAPCGGSSGLPKEAARPEFAAAAIAPAAVAVRTFRLEIMICAPSKAQPRSRPGMRKGCNSRVRATGAICQLTMGFRGRAAGFAQS